MDEQELYDFLSERHDRHMLGAGWARLATGALTRVRHDIPVEECNMWVTKANEIYVLRAELCPTITEAKCAALFARASQVQS